MNKKQLKKYIQKSAEGLPTESLNDYKNPTAIKRALKKAMKEYSQGKFITKL